MTANLSITHDGYETLLSYRNMAADIPELLADNETRDQLNNVIEVFQHLSSTEQAIYAAREPYRSLFDCMTERLARSMLKLLGSSRLEIPHENGTFNVSTRYMLQYCQTVETEHTNTENDELTILRSADNLRIVHETQLRGSSHVHAQLLPQIDMVNERLTFDLNAEEVD